MITKGFPLLVLDRKHIGMLLVAEGEQNGDIWGTKGGKGYINQQLRTRPMVHWGARGFLYTPPPIFLAKPL